MTTYTWSGTVEGSSEKGTSTGLMLKKGELISIVADGWIQFDPNPTCWASPQGCAPGLPGGLKLDAIINGNVYVIGNGVLHWPAPENGELVLVFGDQKGAFGNNNGAFSVKVMRETGNTASTNTTSHEVKGIQDKNTYSYNLLPGKNFGVTTLINTGNSITVNIYAEDSPDALIYTVNGTGAPNKTYSGICTAGKTGKIRVEILANGKPVKQTKYAFQIFDKEYYPQLAVLAAEDGTDNDFNDAIVILNWPLG